MPENNILNSTGYETPTGELGIEVVTEVLHCLFLQTTVWAPHVLQNFPARVWAGCCLEPKCRQLLLTYHCTAVPQYPQWVASIEQTVFCAAFCAARHTSMSLPGDLRVLVFKAHSCAHNP